MRHELFRFWAFFRLIFSHPLTKHRIFRTLLKFCKLNWQLIGQKGYRVHSFTPKTKLLLANGMTNALMNLYCGLLEFEDMAFVLHFLRKEDCFVDAGANVGCYSVLAGGHIGSRVLAFEPVPSTFAHLEANVRANGIEDRVSLFRTALGANPGYVAFTSTYDTVNRVATSSDNNTIQVPVNSLDNLIVSNPKPALLKLDVEGYEQPVLQGAGCLLRQPELRAIIVELNGSGTRYAMADLEIHDSLVKAGFLPFRYAPFSRKLLPLHGPGKHNTLYLRDLEFIKTRIESAERVEINNLGF